MKTASCSRSARLVLLGTALLLAAGCGESFQPAYVGRARECRSAQHPASACPADAMAHGGLAPPNGQAFDAMFFENYGQNPFVDADVDSLSTFAVDVDTASYALARRYLSSGHLPPEAAVRVEEFVNAFDYGYEPPEDGTFAVHLEAAPDPDRRECMLLRVGLRARTVSDLQRKDAVLTFVIDVSGSMARDNRLGLVKRSLLHLVSRLRPADRVGIVVYGSSAGVVLRPTEVAEQESLVEAIESLRTGGCTNAEEGLMLGYRLAREAFRPGAVNRVILCSDGVANMGRTSAEEILERVRGFARRGITLSSLGFGMGNYNDVLMEKLGDKGDGHYAYVDSFDEARRLFGRNLAGALQVVARDVKVQVAFEPGVVRNYRLLGYENRAVEDRDFRNDRADGGEVGAGHAVTALYQVRLWDGKGGRAAEVRLRWRDPDSGVVVEASRALWTSEFLRSFAEASAPFRLAAAAARFAEILRGSRWVRVDDLRVLAGQARGLSGELDGRPDVEAFARLVERAANLHAEAGEQRVEKGRRNGWDRAPR